jgi:NitT/TauT family transport system substrate-binding protein
MIATPTPVEGAVGVGYLMSDHHAALFVAIKKWEYFNDTYGIALKPRDPAASRPDTADLMVNGEKVAELKLISGDAGPQLMQLMATDNIQFALVETPPQSLRQTRERHQDHHGDQFRRFRRRGDGGLSCH